MALELLTEEERQRILKTLEKDTEFRLAIAGLLGLREILEELRKLREDFNRFVVEQEKRWEENNRRWEEVYKRFEHIETTLAIHTKNLEQLTKAIGELKSFVGSIGRRWGRDLEKMILELYRDIVKGFGIDIERIEKVYFRDYDGKYLQRGARIELDIYMSNSIVYLIEVKSLVEEEDIEWFNKKCEIFAKEKNISNYKKLVIAINITKEALERAKELGIETIYGSVIE
ncbi:Protein of unknown function DUF1626 [Ignisphaera aggregans DSM 17230]|uniref:DUF3782 domain-containing protein n=1 Tax=Ignisphaera aggregans (strain DSM 17230 / JCM 13409 / AQ1.S1) TaxID=583356 RepID=E0SSC7_IGNAA|nr:Protein of unknown function DUF1626 [Ignisphaera aggregans DSM 17230]